MSGKMNIDQIAELARLHLKPEEREKLSRDLEKILDYVDQLKELKTDNVPPTTHVLPLQNVFRKDQAVPHQVREDVLKRAPNREGNFFKVPKVIEGQ